MYTTFNYLETGYQTGTFCFNSTYSSDKQEYLEELK